MDLALIQDAPTDVFIANTFRELGIRSFRCLHDRMLVRCLPLPERTPSGRLYLPPKMATFYGQLPHMQEIYARVVCVGPKVKEVKPGDSIFFMRLYFSRWEYGSDRTVIGWLRENDIIGWVDDASSSGEVDARSDRGAA